jgi:hypothetical protein
MTFAELESRVKFSVDVTGFRMPVNIRKLLHEAENEFIRRTLCTQKYVEYYIESPDKEYDDTKTKIAFVKGTGTTKDTITDSSSGFSTDGFAADQIITIDGSTSNDGDYELYSVAAGTLTLKSIGRLTSEAGITGMTIKAETIPNIITLPTDFLKEYLVEYGDYILTPLSNDVYPDLYTSTSLKPDTVPYNYWIEGSYLKIEPRPADADTLKIWYHYWITDDTSTSPIIPTLDQLRIVDYTIASLYEMDQKPEMAQWYHNRFNEYCLERQFFYHTQQLKQYRISQ